MRLDFQSVVRFERQLEMSKRELVRGKFYALALEIFRSWFRSLGQRKKMFL